MIREFLKYHPNLKEPSDLGHLCIRILLNKRILVEKNMRMEQIYQRIREHFPETFLVYNNDNDRQPMLRVYVRTSIKSYDVSTTAGMISLAQNILKTTVRGVPGVRGAYLRKEENYHSVEPDTGRVVKRPVYYIETAGSNLPRILELPWFDHRLIQTDGIQETHRTFGVGAANTKIVNELRYVVSGIADVAYRHYTIYADEMTATGLVTSIDRYGSARRNAPILLRMSDSVPLTVLEESALANAKDRLHGVSPAILMGKNPRVGDLYNSVILDEEMVRRLAPASNALARLGLSVE
jgi:hypothetical protein